MKNNFGSFFKDAHRKREDTYLCFGKHSLPFLYKQETGNFLSFATPLLKWLSERKKSGMENSNLSLIFPRRGLSLPAIITINKTIKLLHFM